MVYMSSAKAREAARALKFVLFSASAGLIELGAFALNRAFTFRSTANIPRAMALVALYYCAFTPASTVLGSWLAEGLMWNEYLVTGINMLLNLVTEYFFDRFVVFGGTIGTNSRAK